MTAYLLYLGLRRYLLFDEYDWPERSHAHIYSVMAVALQVFALVLAPFFIAASCFKVGNLASDGERLGDRTKKVVDVLAGTPLCRKLKSAWQHGPPVAQTIHLSMAFALLMAHTLMETQFFKHHGSSILKTGNQTIHHRVTRLWRCLARRASVETIAGVVMAILRDDCQLEVQEQ